MRKIHYREFAMLDIHTVIGHINKRIADLEEIARTALTMLNQVDDYSRPIGAGPFLARPEVAALIEEEEV